MSAFCSDSVQASDKIPWTTTSPVIQSKHQVVVTFPPPPFFASILLRNGEERVSPSAYLGVTPGYFLFLSSIHPCRGSFDLWWCVPACVKERRIGCDRLVRLGIEIIGNRPSPTLRALLCRSSATDWVLFHKERAQAGHALTTEIDCNAHMPAGKRSRMWIVMGPIPSRYLNLENDDFTVHWMLPDIWIIALQRRARMGVENRSGLRVRLHWKQICSTWMIKCNEMECLYQYEN